MEDSWHDNIISKQKILWKESEFANDEILRSGIVNPTLGSNFVVASTRTNFRMMEMLMANTNTKI